MIPDRYRDPIPAWPGAEALMFARRLAGRARRVLETCGRLPGVHADADDCPCEACCLVREIPVEWGGP